MSEIKKDSNIEIARKENEFKYAELLKETHALRASNQENHDKTIITFSTAGLALIIAFFKIFDTATALNMWMFNLAFLLFLISIIIVLFSYHAAIFSIEKFEARMAIRYGVKKQVSKKKKKIPQEETLIERVANYCNYLSSVTFVLAIVFSFLFFSANLNSRDSSVTKSQKTHGVTKELSGSNKKNMEKKW